MHLKKTAVAAALTALAVPAAAQADRPDHAGERGKAKAERTQTKQTKSQKAKKSKGVGFTAAGIGLTELPYADGKLTGPFSLDLTSANKHARTVLGADRSEIQGPSTFEIPVVAGAAAKLQLGEGVDANGNKTLDGGELLATDRVKVIGKVTRQRKGSTAARVLDVKKIVVSRETEQDDD